jgi:hypothetical protein
MCDVNSSLSYAPIPLSCPAGFDPHFKTLERISTSQKKKKIPPHLMMAQRWPSIQSFFQPEGAKARKAGILEPGDGFTTGEVDAVLHPASRPWIPRQEYTEQNIGDVVSGPGRVTFTGRVVNLFEMQMPSKMPRAAKGFVKAILKDDTGALVVTITPSLL